MAQETIRTLIADGDAGTRGALRRLLAETWAAEPAVEVVGEAADPAQAMTLCRALQPDVMLMDMMGAAQKGIEVIRAIGREMPQVRILIVSECSNEELVFAAIRAGAHGYILQEIAPDELVQAVQEVYQGRSVLHPSLALRILQDLSQSPPARPVPDPLTLREVEILKLVARGMSNQTMAEELGISERTVGTHVSNILTKLRLANRTQAALYALRTGIATLYPDEEGRS